MFGLRPSAAATGDSTAIPTQATASPIPIARPDVPVNPVRLMGAVPGLERRIGRNERFGRFGVFPAPYNGSTPIAMADPPRTGFDRAGRSGEYGRHVSSRGAAREAKGEAR